MALQGKRVLVIGGASGIGLGVAEAALASGAEVVLAGRSLERLEAARRTLVPSGRVTVAPLDVAREDEVRRLLAEEAAPLDHIVITAAHAHVRPLRDLELEDVRRVLEVKVVAAVAVARYARLRPGGSLTLTSGINALRPMPGVLAVVAANGALQAMVRALALELAPLRVNALSPGWVDTPIWDAFGPGEKERRFASRARELPAGRIGTPHDLGQAAVFLMENGFTTGTILEVDGGHRLV